jgi:hypothetical protein
MSDGGIYEHDGRAIHGSGREVGTANPKLAKAVEPEDWSDKFPTQTQEEAPGDPCPVSPQEFSHIIHQLEEENVYTSILEPLRKVQAWLERGRV